MRKGTKSKKQRCDPNFLSRIDIYGIPITLQFEEKMRYKTNFGAMLSIFTGLAFVVFGGFKFIEMSLHMNSNIRMYPENLNLLDVVANDEEIKQISDHEHTVAFSLQREMPREIGEVKVSFERRERQEDGSVKAESTELGIVPCQREMFHGDDEDMAKYPWASILKS